MKSIKTLLLASLCTIAMSCNSDDDGTTANPNDGPNADIETNIEGTYTITRLDVDNVASEQDFQGFTFQFTANGTVIGENDLFAETGSWNYSTTSTNDTLNEFLFLDFNQQDPFTDLERNWVLTERIDNEITLSDTTSTNVDRLTFTIQ
jgi:hypothetical protein